MTPIKDSKTITSNAGACIKMIRTYYGISRKEFAARANVSERYMTLFENGKIEQINTHVYGLLVDEFGVDLDKMFRLCSQTDITNKEKYTKEEAYSVLSEISPIVQLAQYIAKE